MKDLFTIGEIHKLFGVPVRTLRFYDAIGLLRPERVDPRTGYRYYSAGQFERLNTIKYLRALGVSLERIRGFFENRDTDVMEQLLREQLAGTRRQIADLRRIERRIGRRLADLQQARTAETGVIREKVLPARPVAFLRREIAQGSDLEPPLAELQSHLRQDAAVFLGKVGVSIARERLYARQFDRYAGIFVFVEPEERWVDVPSVEQLPAGSWLTICYRGTHEHSAAPYNRLMDDIARRGLALAGGSVEVTHIDAGFTSDQSQYLTELQIPVEKSEKPS